MGRIKTIFISISISASSLLFAQSDTSDSSVIQEALVDISAILQQIEANQNGYAETFFDFFSDGFSQYVLGDSLHENVTQPLIDEIDSLSSGIQSIYDTIQQQGGTKDDWQSLRDSLMSMQNNLYYLSTIQSDTSTMSSTVYSLYNEVMALNSTLSSKLDSMQDSDNTNFNNLLDSLAAKLDSVISSIDQFRYFDFSITANVDFEPLLYYLRQISDDGVKINGFDGDIYITNSVDLSEIIQNQQIQIEHQEEQITHWEKLDNFLGIPYYTLDEYFYSITHGNTNDWKQASLKGVTYYLWEIRKVLDSITNSISNLSADSQLSSINSLANEYVYAGDSLISEYSHIGDTAYNYLTNSSRNAEIIQTDYDFSSYTNITDVVRNIKDDYYYTSMIGETNQFVTASTLVTQALNNQVESMIPLFERSYRPIIVIDWDLLGVDKQIDLSRYVTFNSENLKICWDFVIWISSILFGFMALKNIWEN